MNRVISHILNNNLFSFQTNFDHLLLNNLCCYLRFCKRIRPGIAKHSLSHHTIFITSNNLKHFGCGSPGRSDYSHFVRRNFVHAHSGHIYINIRGYIMMWVMHFVEQLLTQGVKVDAPTSARSFADHSITILPHFRNRIAYVRDIRYRAPISSKVSSSRLTATLKEMSNDDALGQSIPVVPTPTQLMYHGSEEKSGICDTACQYDISSCIQVRKGDAHLLQLIETL